MVVPGVVCLLVGWIQCSAGVVIAELIRPACQPSVLGHGTMIDVLSCWPISMI